MHSFPREQILKKMPDMQISIVTLIFGVVMNASTMDFHKWQ